MSTNVPSNLSTPVAPPESNSLQLPIVGPSVNYFCNKMGRKLSKRCTDGRSIQHFILRVLVYCPYIETILVVPSTRSPRSTRGRSTASGTRSAESWNTWRTAVFHIIEPRNTAIMTEYPQYRIPKYSECSQYPAVHKTHRLRVRTRSAWSISLGNSLFYSRHVLVASV